MAPKNPYEYDSVDLKAPPSWVYDYKPYDIQKQISDQEAINAQELNNEKMEQVLREAQEEEAKRNAYEAEMQAALSQQDPTKMNMDQIYNTMIPSMVKQGMTKEALEAMRARESENYRQQMLGISQGRFDESKKEKGKPYTPKALMGPGGTPSYPTTLEEENRLRAQGYLSPQEYQKMQDIQDDAEIFGKGKPQYTHPTGDNAPQSVPPGYKLQINKKTGETRLVPK